MMAMDTEAEHSHVLGSIKFGLVVLAWALGTAAFFVYIEFAIPLLLAYWAWLAFRYWRRTRIVKPPEAQQLAESSRRTDNSTTKKLAALAMIRTGFGRR
jgi:hypothetical protein